DEGIRLIEFNQGKSGYVLERYDELLFPETRIYEGVIQNKDGLIADLIALRKKNGIYQIRASIPDERGYVFGVKIANIPGADMRSSIESFIEENVPLSVAESVFDYSITGSETEG